MSFETESYKEMQAWEIITRLKKLEGDDLDSLVKCGSDKMSAAVKLSVDSAENPYVKKCGFSVLDSCLPKPIYPYVLYDRSINIQAARMAQASNPFSSRGLQQASALGMLGGSQSILGW